MKNAVANKPVARAAAPSRAIRFFAVITSLSTLFLIFVGSLVTSTGSALAVPDWPLAYGMIFPPMVGGVFYEHGHRIVASIVGFMTLLLAVWLARAEPRPLVRRCGWFALGAVIAQGILGGMTVLFMQRQPLSIIHGVLAQTFFMITIFLAYSQSNPASEAGRTPPYDKAPRSRRLVFAATSVVYIQLILGAVMRHTNSGLAIPDFPTMAGIWMPMLDASTLERIASMRFDANIDPAQVTFGQVAIHLSHRMGALIVSACVLALALHARRLPSEYSAFKRGSYALVFLLLIQIALGAFTVWTLRAPYIASFHVLTGASMLGLCTVLSLMSLPASLFAYANLPRVNSSPSLMHSYVALTKPRLLSMVLVSASLGFFLAESPDATLTRFLMTMFGIGLAGAGSSVLNQYLEREADTKMERTRLRPLPTGAIPPLHALLFGVALVLSGIFILESQVNLLSSFLVLLTTFLYVLVYTPLKRLTWLNTTIGAIPGAIPTLAGWAAAADHLAPAAWILFAILFFWQHPHFYAIAWLYRDDYRQGDFKMLPVVDPDGSSTFRQILIFTALLIGASLAPVGMGSAGSIYIVGALILGILFFASGIRLAIVRSTEQARSLFQVSLLYLPCLLLLLAADSIICG